MQIHLLQVVVFMAHSAHPAERFGTLCPPHEGRGATLSRRASAVTSVCSHQLLGVIGDSPLRDPGASRTGPLVYHAHEGLADHGVFLSGRGTWELLKCRSQTGIAVPKNLFRRT